jgi:hypothetical protein
VHCPLAPAPFPGAGGFGALIEAGTTTDVAPSMSVAKTTAIHLRVLLMSPPFLAMTSVRAV